jgi:hypothetical protein
LVNPAFFQGVGELQRRVEEELELLDVRACLVGSVTPGCWAVGKLEVWRPPA